MGDVPTIATGRYHGGLVAQSGLLPIGVTVGAAKFLPYELAANLGALAPYGLLKIKNRQAFQKAYIARLERFGADRILSTIEAVRGLYDAPGVVLLCFEDVLCTDEWCHRRMLAEWLMQAEGLHVPELAPVGSRAGVQVRKRDLYEVGQGVIA